ncbi:MAG: ROK family protein, partial [Planctomyces sp.]
MNQQQQARLYLGIDLGGTNIKAGVVSDSGLPLGFASVPAEAQAGPLHGVQQMVRAAELALLKAGVDFPQITAAGLA